MSEANIQKGTPSGPKLPRWVIGLAGAVGLALAIFVVKPMLKSGASLSAEAASSIWSISNSKDAMTDATRNVAVTLLEGQHAHFELHVTCGSDKLLRYELNAFDAENKPVAYRSELTDDATTFVPFQVRVDQLPASDQRMIEPQFNNQIFIENRVGNQLGLAYNDVDLPVRMAQGAKVLFRVPVSGGDETLSIAQTDPAFRKMVEPCLLAEPKAAAVPNPVSDGSAPASTAGDVNASASGSASSGSANGQLVQGKCELRIKGIDYLKGACSIELEADGSFSIFEHSDRTGYFAMLQRDGASGQGYWNGSRSSSHAQDELGQLTRNGACWENSSAKICAWS